MHARIIQFVDYLCSFRTKKIKQKHFQAYQACKINIDVNILSNLSVSIMMCVELKSNTQGPVSRVGLKGMGGIGMLIVIVKSNSDYYLFC